MRSKIKTINSLLRPVLDRALFAYWGLLRLGMRRLVMLSLGVASIFVAIYLPTPAQAENRPPKNPYLADSSYAMAHGDSAQQDSVAQKGPTGPSRTLGAADIDYRHLGPAHFGAVISGVYADGRRVFWGNGIDRIVKMDHDTYRVLDEYFFPGAIRYDAAQADESIASFDKSNSGFWAIYRAFKAMSKLRDLSNLYTLLDREHVYYVGSNQGLITAYVDAEPEDSRSPIIKHAEFQLPAYITGPVMGLNMSYDGWLIVATEHGYMAAIKRDFSDFRSIRLLHSEGAEDKATGPTGKGWIRNGFAIDDAGGVYIASQDHMHKVIWTGDAFSTDPATGAWTAAYRNGKGEGTGATPSLMGFGHEDRFVVITDGDALMNLVLFWRDAIPDTISDAGQPLPGALNRRIAGILPVDMDDPELEAIQSEQSVVVSGYGALVVNNNPRGLPWYLPAQAGSLLSSVLGSNPEYQPFGVQKFEWNPQGQVLQESWVNKQVSSPSSVPIVSAGSNMVYLIGARDNRWTLEALNWSSGESEFHQIIGGQRYNVLFAGTMLDEKGRIHYGTPWGRVRIK